MFWLRVFGLQIRFALTCLNAFIIPLTKLGKGAAGWVLFILIIRALTEPLPPKLKAAQLKFPQQVEQTTTVYLLEPLCNRWQMIRLCCNLFVFILIRDKHLPGRSSHTGSVLMWLWGHIKPLYCTLGTPTHCPHTQRTHTICSGLFSVIHGSVWPDESEQASVKHDYGVGVG